MKYGLKPIINGKSLVLILGSFPGEESLQLGQYYAHPRNHFWKILAGMFKEPAPVEWREKLEFLTSHRIALWDVIECASHKGSSDAKIDDSRSTPNDLLGLLERHPGLRAIAFNGHKSKDYFNKFIKQGIDAKIAVPQIQLPSSSPALAVLLEKKIEIWNHELSVYLRVTP